MYLNLTVLSTSYKSGNCFYFNMKIKYLSSLANMGFGLLQGDIESHGPVCYDDGVTYMFIQHNNVFLMTASRQNSNAASLLLFLHRVVDVSSLANCCTFPFLGTQLLNLKLLV